MPAFAELFRTSVVLYAFARGQALCGRAFVFDEFLNLGRGEGLMDFIRCVSVEDHFAREISMGYWSNLHAVSPLEIADSGSPRCIHFASKGLSAENNCAFFGTPLAFLPCSPRTRRLALGSNGAKAAQTEPLTLPVPYRQAWRRASLRFTPISRPSPRQDAEKSLLRKCSSLSKADHRPLWQNRGVRPCDSSRTSEFRRTEAFAFFSTVKTVHIASSDHVEVFE